ncbi:MULTISPECIES: S41 family peptidase [Clostridium]|uniref:Carboxyl-terminal processing protease n=1 Tax=Clostridium cadaveris TaxID=1529 RepID=A0A1I2K1V2_9CLOT|nr:S41 family peptidase [Clostridium cadaveris]MDU4950973.1 S41 family peptidase [Clostridium sp.]MDM8312180.1 S41 family peptidase [Clostridium cadaveris]MDY4949084.1 S41 family peptidase [Clostridium cadaveris]NWK12506.1 S41 family peptidase [Clostridium cadaveris]UFH65532.1 S41 family peptidase [Clostridium cadaveris]
MDNEEIKETKKRRKLRWKWIAIVAAILIVTNFAAFFVGTKAAMAIPGMGVSNKDIAKSLEGISDVSKFKKLFQVRDVLYKLYDGEINEDTLVEGAIKGMTNSLNDPYTVFMNKKEFSDFNERNEGNYVGVGLQVAAKDEDIVVIAVFNDSPAEKAGIKPGDKIKKVAGTDVGGKDLEKAVALMKNGKAKEKVDMTLYREGKGLYTTEVYRDTIVMQTVAGEMIEGNIGYIQISMFDEHTGDAFTKKLQELKDSGAKGIILDLRQNPGGLLKECINVVSNFVEKDKVITSTIDKYNKETKYNSKGGIAIGMPLVVLTDENTASASEIVAGAVRDYDIGTLIGTTTFGKGVVQTVLGMDEGTGLKVTISKYYTPNGENIHKKGIAPHIEVTIPKEIQEKGLTRSNDPQFNKALEAIKDKIK